MIIQTNQTTYKCSYCGRRKLSKRGCIEHENKYCKNELSPHMLAIRKKQDNCLHEHRETVYSYIPGECVKEPDYDICIDCGKEHIPF